MLLVREDKSGDSLIDVKAVPGAKRDEIAGLLGERLKIRVSAAPEGGKANRAICSILAEALGMRAGDVQIVRGASDARKTIRLIGMDAHRARKLLGNVV